MSKPNGNVAKKSFLNRFYYKIKMYYIVSLLFLFECEINLVISIRLEPAVVRNSFMDSLIINYETLYQDSNAFWI